MLMQALVISTEVGEFPLYDQMTGIQKTNYSVRMSVLDLESHEKYECQISEGIPALEDLKVLKKQGQPADVMQQAALALQGQLPAAMSQMTLFVKRVKANKGGFVTLVCSVAAA